MDFNSSVFSLSSGHLGCLGYTLELELFSNLRWSPDSWSGPFSNYYPLAFSASLRQELPGGWQRPRIRWRPKPRWLAKDNLRAGDTLVQLDTV